MEKEQKTDPQKEQSTDLAIAGVAMLPGGVFANEGAFKEAGKMAQYLASSQIVPQQYQGSTPNCIIAIDIARRLNIAVLEVMQNLYVVNGKPSWSGQFALSRIKGCGSYTNVHYECVGTKGKMDRGIRIVAKVKETGAEVAGPWVDMEMAKGEGWLDKKGSKWKTMPEMMLKYRAATFFARTECPEVLMGIQEQDEIIDLDPRSYNVTVGPADNGQIPTDAFDQREPQGTDPETTNSEEEFDDGGHNALSDEPTDNEKRMLEDGAQPAAPTSEGDIDF